MAFWADMALFQGLSTSLSCTKLYVGFLERQRNVTQWGEVIGRRKPWWCFYCFGLIFMTHRPKVVMGGPSIWPSLSDRFGCFELLPGQSSVVLLTLTSMKKVSYTVGMSFQTWQKMKSQTMHSEMRANRSSLVVSESPLKRNLGLLNEQKKHSPGRECLRISKYPIKSKNGSLFHNDSWFLFHWKSFAVSNEKFQV